MYIINSWLSNRDSSLQSASQFISVIPGGIGRYMRVAFYRLVLDKCEWSVTFEFGTLLSKCNASFGSNVYIGPKCQLGMVTLEEDVLLGPAVQIPSGGKIHSFDSLDVPIREQGGVKSMVTIGRDSWIGCGAIILCDVSEQTIVGAGSVVTKQFPVRSIWLEIQLASCAREERVPHSSRHIPCAVRCQSLHGIGFQPVFLVKNDFNPTHLSQWESRE